MPRIPTFVADAQPTEEVGAVKSNIQISPNETIAGTLLPAAQNIEKYYVKEKEISNKVEGGELIAKANQELQEVAEKSKLKSTPDQGVNFFNSQYSNIINKYKSQAGNNYIKKYFDINMNLNKPSYTNSILKTTRKNMVKTRVDQVDTRVKNKIVNGTLDENTFDFATLANDIRNDYQGLVDDGIISEQTFKNLEESIPQEIEIGIIRGKAQTNAAEAILILTDPNQLTNIPREQKRKLVTEFGALLKIQENVIENSNTASQINNFADIVEKFKVQEKVGIEPEELEKFKNGDIEFDNQIDELNTKVIDKKFSDDTNFSTNTDIINKIYDGTITKLTTKFLLAGEKVPRSIIERGGDGSVNINDLNFLKTVFTRSNNNTTKKEDEKFLKFITDLEPVLQGNNFVNFYDKQYDSKASSLRQTLYTRFVNGLLAGETPENLTTPNNKNYIAKDIASYLPKTSDLDSIAINMASAEILPNGMPKREENEDADSYIERIKNFSGEVFDTVTSFFGDDDIVSLWSKNYQTDDSILKEVSARRNLKINNPVPEPAKKAIDIASSIFDGDNGFSKATLKSYLTDIGHIETKYETKIQVGANPEINNFYARSYWQVEVKTAKDLLSSAAPLFGPKFEKQFGNYKGNFKTAREGLLNLSDKDLTLIIEKDDALAASFAAAIIVQRF
tara:strand:- start:1300 stop:3330 length:2031 start_codon:yes stop_codon:yes gene_type:complete